MPKSFRAGSARWCAVGFLVLAGCAGPRTPEGSTPILSQPGEVAVQGRYVHAGSGMAFPTDGTAAGSRFVRVTVTQFDDKGRDVSANYDVPTPSGRMRISAYVYPVPLAFALKPPKEADAAAVRLSEGLIRSELCRQEQDRRKQELLDFHPEARLLREGAIRPPHGEAGVPGNVVTYETRDFINNTKGLVRSEIYIFCYVQNLWIVKYRVTPVQDSASEAILADFMRQVPWTSPTPG
ncbi:hypothetical protein [Inquilinus sp. CA228]|uniref:hypothetical protein n=1 Tax=Inquilinus sp. CA228 TaxID=3455609 RepID=UPI003F8D0344